MMKRKPLLVLAFVCGFSLRASPSAAETENTFIKVEIKGVMRVFAPAGDESTGVEIRAAGTTWELSFKGSKVSSDLVRELNGKMVLLTGSYNTFKGLEVPEHRVVAVDTLKPGEGS